MKHIFEIILFVLLTSTAYCQNTDTLKTKFIYKNSAQVELGGHGLYYSLMYERVIFNGHKFKTTGQIGFAYYPPQSGIINVWGPIMINELISFNKHHIELGLGYVFTFEPSYGEQFSADRNNGFIAARLGYRYQRPDGRLIIRVGFTPLIERGFYHVDFHPLGGLAFGYSFGKK